MEPYYNSLSTSNSYKDENMIVLRQENLRGDFDIQKIREIIIQGISILAAEIYG
jgi:hypothetical protein